MGQDNYVSSSDTNMIHDAEKFLIAGIGASAGGIQALKLFFENVSERSGIAYVVILHLSPDHDSKLAEVLQLSTKMQVTQVTKKIEVKPNHVYVIPPDRHLQMEDGFLAVSPNMQVEDRRAPVDIFFRTLAESHGQSAVCVVLSGTGANGSMGLKRIKERGGAAFVQNPREAEFNEMPRNSIATELVDEILPVAEIPAKILSYSRNLGVLRIPEETEPGEEQQKALREIFTQLRIRTGHDFTNYKRATLFRRIERRINIRNLPDLPSYAEYLLAHTEECVALLKDLLISVTNFFRDRKHFEALEQEIIPKILNGKTAAQQVRIWVAGCATGEEAYSMALLLAERTLGTINAPKIQIFATDIDEGAIAHAREGLYTLNDAADVSPERLRRFFTKEGDGYRIRREIREMVLFANHNFLKDPPFSHLDLVTCRNVLIYLNRVAQERVLQTFHFALKPGNYLFLGSSESIEGSGDLFLTYSRDHHLFQSRQIAQRTYPIPESVPLFRIESAGLKNMSQETERKSLERITFGDLHQRLLEQYAPPSVVVNEEYEIVHLSENAGRYMQLGGGEISQNLLKLIRPELRMELRSALYRTTRQQVPVNLKDITVLINDQPESLNIIVKPVLRRDDPAQGFILIIFEPSNTSPSKDEFVVSANEPIARQLEEELLVIRSQLRNSVEQHELQAEELKASNEELQAMNEELRSAAEELETSKEELQSINEELRTVNQELKVKIDETTLSGNNLQNLINSADIGTIFLDRSLLVRLFTPAARDIFNLLPADYGRPLTDITNRLEYENIAADAENVLEKLITVSKEVQTTDGRCYLMRILPYRTAEDRINGVVFTFVDITRLKKAQESLLESEAHMSAVFSEAKVGLFEISIDGKFLRVNETFCRMLQRSREELLQLTVGEVTDPEDQAKGLEAITKLINTGDFVSIDKSFTQTNGNKIWVNNLLSLLNIGDSKEPIILGVSVDLTERRNAEKMMKVAADRDAYLITLSDALRPLHNPLEIQAVAAEVLGHHTGASRVHYGEVEADDAHLFVHRDFTNGVEMLRGRFAMKDLSPAVLEELQAGRSIVIPDLSQSPLLSKDEVKIYSGIGVASMVGVPLIKDDRFAAVLAVQHTTTHDWTTEELTLIRETAERTWGAVTQSRAEQALRESEERFRAIVSQATAGIYRTNVNGEFIFVNSAFYKMLGYSEEEMSGKKIRDFMEPDDIAGNETLFRRMIDNGLPFETELRLLRKDGGIIWTNITIAAIRDRLGIPLSTVAVILDITVRKALQQQKEDFIGIASHELKTPVTSIKAYVDVLGEILETTNEATASEIAKKLNAQVDRLSELIRGLLDITKISEGLMPLHPKQFDLSELIAERADTLQQISRTHRLQVSAKVGIIIDADRERIGQALTNLITNAINYSPAGGDISISCIKNHKEVSVSVSDEGIGMEDGMKEKIFERFFRTPDAATQKQPGMGLGLYITANIIQRHGGTISVESEPGKGSVFTITLPIKNDQ